MPPLGGVRTPLTQRVDSLVAGQNQGYAINADDMTQFRSVFQPDLGIFSPGYPLAPPQPGAVRSFDFPVGWNINYQPRAYDPISFAQLRALADSHDITRLAIETRKDQLEKLDWAIKPRDEKNPKQGHEKRIEEMARFWEKPDGITPFATWLRSLMEDVLVLDAPTLEVRHNRGGQIIGLDVVDGSTIKVLIDDTGHRPMPPAPSYMQVIKGRPWRLLTNDELIYSPRNPRPNKVYGFSPVEQIIMTVNIGLRRQLAQLQWFTDGNVPKGMINAPENWTPEQLASYQEWFDSKLAGNTAERAGVVWGPSGAKYQPFKDGPIKDEFDEWLARVVCYAFSLPPTAFTRQVNRATAQTTQEAALEEGLAPLMGWVKRLADFVIQIRFGFDDLEFAWGDIRPVDPKQQSEIIDTYVKSGVMVIDEARDKLGLDPYPNGLGKVPLILSGSGALRLEDAIAEPEEPQPIVLGPDGKPLPPGAMPPGADQQEQAGTQNDEKAAEQQGKSEQNPQKPSTDDGEKGGTRQQEQQADDDEEGKRNTAKAIASMLARKAADDDELLKASRISKAEAGYMFDWAGEDTCSACSMYDGAEGCSLVKGRIDPGGHCDYWEALDKTITTETGLVADDRARRLGKATAEEIDAAAAAAHTDPSEHQKANGNYAKGHVKLHGLQIAIENPKGSTRSGTSRDGTEWSVEMPAHYGYIKRTIGSDGDQVDVYIGPDPESETVFVIDQLGPDGMPDEHKVMLGYTLLEDALGDYRLAFSDDVDRIGAVHRMSIDGFKTWLRDGDTTMPIGLMVGKAAGHDWTDY